MIRKATAVWEGDLKGGAGKLNSASGAHRDVPYTFATRFEDKPGTNPEELIAAAHAGCFAMYLSGELTKAGLKAERIETTAEVKLDTVEGKPTVTHSHLRLRARVPGVEQAQFDKLVASSKENCPISRLLKAEITVDAILESGARV